MNRLRSRLAVLLLPALLACGDPVEPGREADLIDLRPVWEPGRVYEVRLERRIHIGEGTLPPTGVLGSRSTSTDTFLDHYTEEVLTGSGTYLARTVRTYLRSRKGTDGKQAVTRLEGNAYEIEDPFGAHRATLVEKEGGRPPADEEEQKLLKASSLLLAATLIPDGPVAEGASWRPGRDLAGLSTVGSGGMGLGCRLAAVREEGDRTIAEVTGTIGGKIGERGAPGARMSAREVLHVDLTSREIRTYRSVMEIQFLPAPGNREGGWRYVEAVMTVKRR